MARQRMVNPAFFVDEDVAKLSPLARLLFVGLWTHADKRGRMEDRPARIKVQLLPYDDCDVETLLAEIAAKKFVTRYETDGKKVIQIRSFAKYQKPHPKEPDSTLPGEPCFSTASSGKKESAVYVRPESFPSESESFPSESDGLDDPTKPGRVFAVEATKALAAQFDGPRRNPLMSNRESWATRWHVAVSLLAELKDQDPTEIAAEHSMYKGARGPKLNPATMSEDRLMHTVRSLEKALAEERKKREGPPKRESQIERAEREEREYQASLRAAK